MGQLWLKVGEIMAAPSNPFKALVQYRKGSPPKPCFEESSSLFGLLLFALTLQNVKTVHINLIVANLFIG